ncbi:MAG: protease modulator HflC [Planctomycetaceae bacterium]
MADIESKNSEPDRVAVNWSRRLTVVLLVAAFAWVAATSVLLVDETEYVIVSRLGRIVAVYDSPASKGLQFKLPWPVDMARRFDRRLQLFDPPGREIFTRDKKNITIGTYICWRIAEPSNEETSDSERPVVKFYRGLGDIETAEARLDSRVRSILGTEIGQLELSGLVSAADSESGPADDKPGALDSLSTRLRERASQRPGEESGLREQWGIEIVDVRVKRLNLPDGNQTAVFERMKSERKKIADRYRSAGMAENRIIRSRADRQYSEVLSRARAEAERIRGKAEADSISILNTAHSQDPEFYRILRNLDAYKRLLNEKTTLVLSASSNLLKLLTEGVPQQPGTSSSPSETPSRPAPGPSDQSVSGVPGAIP